MFSSLYRIFASLLAIVIFVGVFVSALPSDRWLSSVPIADAATKKKKKTTIKKTATSTPLPTATPVPVPIWAADEEKWLKHMHDMPLGSKKVFSLRKYIAAQKNMPTLSPDSVEKIAALLYESAVSASLIVGERTPHAKLVDAKSVGFDVAMNNEKQDLTFMNDFSTVMKLQIAYQSGTAPQFSWTAPGDKGWKISAIEVTREQIQSPTQLVLDHTLSSGSKVTRFTGITGLLVKVYRIDGDQKTLVSRDFYAPTPTIVAIGK
jgi:hypothetical protein